jgi:hypothetical protein
MISIWTDSPPMDPAAPQPYLETDRGSAWIAYRTDRGDHFAVIRFQGVERVTLGDPGDEHRDEPPLWPDGLQRYTFHVVTDSALERRGLRRWVFTFRDDTLDVVARTADVVVRAIHAADARSALGMVLA